MLETPNCTSERVYPIWMLPCGDDHKRKPFHVVHCMAQPPCDATLRLSPGGHSRLPPECVAKFAGQKGWLADKSGYALCPLHKPGGIGRPPSDMPPRQKQAAFLAIRDRNLAAAAERMMKPAKPVGDLAKHTAKVRAATEAAKAHSSATVDFIAGAALADFTELEFDMLAFVVDHPNRVWATRREAAKAGGFNIWTFNAFVQKAIADHYLAQEAIRPGTLRPFRFRAVDQFDPPAMQPEPEESAMPTDEAVVVTVQPVKAEPPRQPTRNDNRRIRKFIESNFDDGPGLWCADFSDELAAKKLGVPRAWVARVRELYGDDRSEANVADEQHARDFEVRADELEFAALKLAETAEQLKKDVRSCERFGTGAATVTAQDKLDAVERELGYRRRVYARRVDDGRMSADFAASQIAIFEAIAADYRRLAKGERLL